MFGKTENFKTFYLKNRLLINCALILICFTANLFAENLKYLTYIIISVLVLLDITSYGISYIIFALPFCNIEGNRTLVLLCIPLIIFFAKTIIQLIKEKPQIVWWTLIFPLATLIYALLPIGEYNQNKFLKLIVLFSIMFLCLIITVKPNFLKLKTNSKVLAISIILSAILSTTYSTSPYLQKYLELCYDSGTLRFQALMSHTNMFSLICQLCLASLLVFILKRNSNLYDYMLFATISILGIFTLSKTYLINLLIMLLILFVFLLKNYTRKTLIASGIFVIICLISCFVLKNYVIIMSNRFFKGFANCKNFDDFMNMITTSRYDLWKEYSYTIWHNPKIFFLGNGFGSYALTTLSAHNAFITLLYMAGLLGFTLFTLSVILLILKHKGDKKFDKAYTVVLLILFLILLVEDFLFYLPPA